MTVDAHLALKDVEAQALYFEPFRKQKTLPVEFDAELILLKARLENDI